MKRGDLSIISAGPGTGKSKLIGSKGMRLVVKDVEDILAGDVVGMKIDSDGFGHVTFEPLFSTLTVESCRETEDGKYVFQWKGTVVDSFPYTPGRDKFVLIES